MGLAGYLRPERRGGGAETCQRKRQGPERGTRLDFFKQASLSRPSLRILRTLCGGREERPRPGKRGKRARGGGPPVHTSVQQALMSSSHSRPQSNHWPCSILPHAQLVYSVLLYFFRSINKCVIVNVKTHQSNNNGTKSKDYPSLLVTAE